MDADGTSQHEGAFAAWGDATSRGVGGCSILATFISRQRHRKSCGYPQYSHDRGSTDPDRPSCVDRLIFVRVHLIYVPRRHSEARLNVLFAFLSLVNFQFIIKKRHSWFIKKKWKNMHLQSAGFPDFNFFRNFSLFRSCFKTVTTFHDAERIGFKCILVYENENWMCGIDLRLLENWMCRIDLRLLVLQLVLQQDVWSKDLLTFLLFLICKHSTAAVVCFIATRKNVGFYISVVNSSS